MELEGNCVLNMKWVTCMFMVMEIIVRILQIELGFGNIDIYECIFASTMSVERIWAMQVYYAFDFEEKVLKTLSSWKGFNHGVKWGFDFILKPKNWFYFNL